MHNSENSQLKLSAWLVLPVLLSVAYLLYWPSFENAWLMDDFMVLVDNPDIRSLANFFEDYYPGRPLRELTFLLDYQFFGLQPAGYHLQQIFWHALNAWLVFLLAIRLSACKPIAWGAALLFLVHPLQVEVVANISHRKDSLALAFCLMSSLAYLYGRNSEQLRRVMWLLGALLLWGVALLAKENAVALITLPIIYELSRPASANRKLIPVALFLGTAALVGRILYLIHDQKFLSSIGPALLKLGSIGRDTPSDYFLTVFKAWAFMASKLVWPMDLTMEYTFPLPGGLLDPWVLSGLFAGVTLVVLFSWAWWRSHPVCLPLGWLLVFWMPTSNLLDHLSYFAADRYWYSPLVGVCILVGYGLWWLCRNNWKAYLLAGCLVLLPLTWQTWKQQRVWSDAETFYTHMLRVSPESLEGLIGKGVSTMEAGNLEAAKSYFIRAARLSPADSRTWQSLGIVAHRQGKLAEALDYFQKALADNPKKPAMLYTNLGVTYEVMGSLAEAESMHRRALTERPGYAKAHYNLGVTLYRAQRLDEALESFAMAARLSPEDVNALFNYGVLASETGRLEEAGVVLARLRQIDPVVAEKLQKEMSVGR